MNTTTQETLTEDETPVLVVIDSDGYLLQAGKPERLKPKERKNYERWDCKIETITIKKFRETEWKWIYDKPKK